jgi:4-amino-4-deoxy-L-arabinose transferase-like glycosyltransferase
MNNTGTRLALVLFLAISVRAGFDVWRYHHLGFVPGDGYASIARNIVAGKGFSPTPLQQFGFRTPGYPLFIAAVWSLVPVSARYAALLVAQVIVSVATCGLLFVIGNTVFDRRAAVGASLLFALSPSMTVHGSRAMTEAFYVFLVALAILFSVRLYRSASLLMAAGFGLVWGVAGLTRPEATLMLAPLLLPTLLAARSRKSTKLAVCVAAPLAKIAVFAPWIARNYLVYGTFVLYAPLGGFNLFYGTYPYPARWGVHRLGTEPVLISNTSAYREITAGFWDPEFLPESAGRDRRVAREAVAGMPVPKSEPSIIVVRDERDMLELDRRFTAAALSNMTDHKFIQLYNIPRHLYSLWGYPSAWWAIDELPSPLKFVWRASYLALLGLFGAGILVARKVGKLTAVPLSWLIVMALNSGVFIVLHAECRHQISSSTFLFLYGGIGASAILRFPALRAPAATGPGELVGRTT